MNSIEGQTPKREFALTVRIEIHRTQYTGERLTVDETVFVSASDFLEIANILGKFHELTQELKDSKPPEKQ